MRDHAIQPVSRTKGEAKRFYDSISKVYDHLIGSSEQKFAEEALDRLNIRGENLCWRSVLAQDVV